MIITDLLFIIPYITSTYAISNIGTGYALSKSNIYEKGETLMAKLPIYDIHQAAYLRLSNINPVLILSGTRVVFQFDSSREVTKLLKKYNDNPSVPLIDYVNNLRRLRSEMLSLRDSQTRFFKCKG